MRALDPLTTRKTTSAAQPVTPFHPLARPDSLNFAALVRGEHALRELALAEDLRPAACVEYG